MSTRLDLVIFGATGYTGKYTVQELHKIVGNDKSLTWGIAGRSIPKLKAVIKSLEKETGEDLSHLKIIVADLNDEDSLKNMTKQTRVIINCCGPFYFYGEPVIKACLETKTHHVDVSGEPLFMEEMQLKYQETARKAGVYLISGCGIDSVPADLGIIYLQKIFGGQINSVEEYLSLDVPFKYLIKSSGAHYATWESLIYAVAKKDELTSIRNQLFAKKLPEVLPRLNFRGMIHKSNIENEWCIPLPWVDKTIVKRSQHLFYEKDKRRPIQMEAYFAYPYFIPIFLFLLCTLFLMMMAKFEYTRKLLLKYPQFFSMGLMSHKGPTDEFNRNLHFRMTLYAEGWEADEQDVDGKPITKRKKLRIRGTSPGYRTTALILAHSATTIAKESDKMPNNGGVLPPGFAFAETSLLENLRRSGLIFDLVE